MSRANFSTNSLHESGSTSVLVATVEKSGKKEKILTAATVILALVAIGLLIALIVVLTSSSDSSTTPATAAPIITASPSQSQLCVAETCLDRSLWIMRAVDNTTDPCTDFYQFACGKWISNAVMPSDKSRIGTFDGIGDDVDKMLNTTLLNWPFNYLNVNAKAVDKAAFAYQQCVLSDSFSIDAEIFAAFDAIIRELGGSSLLTPSWNDSTFNRTTFMSQVQALSPSAFISTYVYSDLKNSSRNRITLMQPGLMLPQKNFYENVSVDPYVTYKNFTASVLKLLSKELSANLTDEEFNQQLDEMLELERKIANATFKPDEIRDESAIYKLVRFADLDPIYRGTIASLTWRLVKQVPEDDELIQILVGPGFLENYAPILRNASPRALSNYGMWYVIRKTLYDGLPPAVRDLQKPLYNVLYGSNPSERWTTCLSLFDSYFAFAIGRLYVDYNFNKQIKIDMEDQIEYIVDAFRVDSLEQNKWLDQETKKLALEKLEAMGRQIAYPEFILDDKLLNDYYEDIEMPTGNKTLLVNILKPSTYGTNKRTLEEWVHRVADRNAWPVGPQTVNAFYSPSANSIYFPGGILYPPFYHHDLPKSMNFGGIGYVIGHEISHGFDDSGSKYDKDGNMANWWTNTSRAAFNERADCMIKQYNNCCYDKFDPKQCVNGEFTQGENIADNGGLRTAFEAYKTWKVSNKDSQLPGLPYTDEQLFFLTSAHVWCMKQTDQSLLRQMSTDPHSPMPYRVNVAMQNLEQFSEIWKCPKDSPMNPEKKCRVW